jgi:uncharacterized protein YgiM (DUF1202 family)
MTKELFVNGELAQFRREAHGKGKQTKSLPVFTSRMEKSKYKNDINYFDIRNVIDVKGFLKEISSNLNTYVLKVNQWIQRNPVKKLLVTGIFTVVLGFFVSTTNAACIQEYTYQVKNGEKIEDIAIRHGVTAQEILDANGLTSIKGKKILLPIVQDWTVTATTLNVRSQPNTESSIIGKYKKGEVVKVSFIENGWAGIFIKGRVCFVSANYLTREQVVPSNTMYVTASSLRIRETASTSSTILGSLKLNDRVTVISTLNGWVKINFKGKEAFVSETYLTNNEPIKEKNEIFINNNANVSRSVYVIKRGDTFTKVSRELGVSVSFLQKLNPTVDATKLKIGQKIKIPITTSSTTNQIKVAAQIVGVDPQGIFQFITSDGSTYSAKASRDILKDLFELKGERLTLTLEGKRGQQMSLITIH